MIYLKKTANILQDKYDNDIPDNVEELCQLPGVGPKMAHLCMNIAWKKQTGIGMFGKPSAKCTGVQYVPKNNF